MARAQQIRFNMQDSNDTDAEKPAKEHEEPKAPLQLSAVALHRARLAVRGASVETPMFEACIHVFVVFTVLCQKC
jgi:hypothetical protein